LHLAAVGDNTADDNKVVCNGLLLFDHDLVGIC
jgi:hypothetical protein